MQDEIRAHIERVHQQAYLDTLTGFGNKSAYLDTVKQLNESIKEKRAAFGVAVFDLNGLKKINDTYGHEYGDMALSDAAERLEKVFGKACLYRFGGDEYIAVRKDATPGEMRHLFAFLDAELEEANRTQHPYVVPLSLSKGAAVYRPGEDADYMEVFQRADHAMYDDKKAFYEKHGDRRR